MNCYKVRNRYFLRIIRLFREMEVDIIEEPLQRSADGLELLVNILSDKYDSEKQLKMVKAFRRLFVKGPVVTLESKVLQVLRIEKLVENVESLQNQESNVEIPEGFLMSYSESVMDFIKLHDEVNQKLVKQLEWVFEKLNQSNSDKIKVFIRNAWTTLEEKSVECISLFEKILASSIFYIEEIVCKWIREIFTNSINACDLKCFVRLSGHLPVLFQSITSILNQFVVMTHCNSKIIEFIACFLESLFNYCEDNKLNIFNLYPRDCCRIVSLIRIPPNVCFIKGKVLEVLWENFQDDKKKVLILLTHFPKWFNFFVDYVNNKS